ncbi:MAG: serine hydrolase [Patescibacteria group bacterium]
MDSKRKYTTYYSSSRSRQVLASNRQNNKKRLVYLACTVLIVLIGYVMFFGDSDKPQSKAQPAPSVPAFTLDSVSLDQNINAILQTIPKNIQTSVAVVDLTNQKSYSYGTQAPFDSASVAKVVTATLFLHKVEQGKYSLSEKFGTETASEQLKAMIEDSDNTAWKLFNDELTHPELDSWARQNGMTSYTSDKNQMTSNDMASLLQKLYAKKLLNEQNTNLLLSHMKVSENSLISQYAPAGATVYRKAGWLSDRYHEATIVDNGKHPYVLVIFSKTSAEVYPSGTGKGMYKSIVDVTTRLFQ